MKLQLQPGQDIKIAIGDRSAALIVERSNPPMLSFSPSMAALLLTALQDAAERGVINPSLYTRAEVKHVQP